MPPKGKKQASSSRGEDDYYDIVKGRRVMPSKFFHTPTLEQMGMLACVTLCLAQCGLGGFLGKEAPAYPELCFQFISSLKWVNREEGDESLLKKITFSYNGRHHELSRRVIHEALSITKKPTLGWTNGLQEAEMFAFWREATRRDFRTGHEVNSKLVNPCLRLIHKVLMRDFFGHADDGKVPMKDFQWFMCILGSVKLTPCWATLFLSSLVRIRMGEPRDICGGSLITLLCADVIACDRIARPVPCAVYDVAHQRVCTMVKPLGDYIVWIAYGGHILRVPRQFIYSPSHEGWWIDGDGQTPAEESPVVA